jgi:hypothetical protein
MAMRINFQEIRKGMGGVREFVSYLMIMLIIMLAANQIFVWGYREYELIVIRIELKKIYNKLNSARVSGDRQEALELYIPTYNIIKKFNKNGIGGSRESLTSPDYCYIFALYLSRSLDSVISFGTWEDDAGMINAFNHCQ